MKRIFNIILFPVYLFWYLFQLSVLLVFWLVMLGMFSLIALAIMAVA